MSETKKTENIFERFDKKQKELEQEIVKLNDEMLELSNDTLVISEVIINLEHDLSKMEDDYLSDVLNKIRNDTDKQLTLRRILRKDKTYIAIRDKILERKKVIHQNKNLIIHKEYLIQLRMALLSRISF